MQASTFLTSIAGYALVRKVSSLQAVEAKGDASLTENIYFLCSGYKTCCTRIEDASQ